MFWCSTFTVSAESLYSCANVASQFFRSLSAFDTGLMEFGSAPFGVHFKPLMLSLISSSFWWSIFTASSGTSYSVLKTANQFFVSRTAFSAATTVSGLISFGIMNTSFDSIASCQGFKSF